MDIFFWIIAALLVGMGGFTGYTNWKLYFQSRKMREHVLKTHQNAKEVHVGTVRIWMYAAMFAACIGLGIMILVMPAASEAVEETRYSQAIVYFGLAVFAAAMFGEALCDGTIVLTPDAILYEADLIRFKNIRAIKPAKGWFKSSMIYMTNAKELAVSKKMAAWTMEEWEKWKEEKKSAPKSRKERRLEARRKRDAQ